MVSGNELRKKLEDAGFRIECGSLYKEGKIVTKEEYLDDDHIGRRFPLIITKLRRKRVYKRI